MVVINNIDTSEVSESLERAVAVNQHHDAITGTEKQRVADNYHARLFKAVEESFETLGIDTVLEVDEGRFKFCPLLNISQVRFSM